MPPSSDRFFYLRRFWRLHFGVGPACWVSFAACLLFVVMAARQAPRPLHLDNMDFPAAAEATAQTGLPVYYRGEDSPEHIGLYHTPLYIYALAGWFKVFGSGPASARMFGVFCALIGALLFRHAIARIWGEEKTIASAPIFWVLYLLNPFALQVFGVADIDSTVLVLLFGGVLLSIARIVFLAGNVRLSPALFTEWLVLFLLLVITLWAKLTTTAALPAALCGLLSIRYGLARGMVATVAVCTCAAALFLATYYAYGLITGLDIDYTRRFLFEMLSSKVGASANTSTFSIYGERLWINFMACTKWDVLPTLLGAALFPIVTAFQHRLSTSTKRLHVYAAMVLLFFSFAVLGAYSLITIPFGNAPFKYIAPVWPVFALAAAFTWTAAVNHCRAMTHRLSMALLAACFVFSTFVGFLYLKDYSILGHDGYIRNGVVTPLICLVLVLVGFFVRSVIAPIFHLWRRSVTASYVAVVISFAGTAFGSALTQSGSRYATQYDYGQRGFIETRKWLISNTSPNEVISSMKDIGFAAHRRYLESYSYLYGGAATLPHFIERTNKLDIKIFVFTEQYGQDQLGIHPGIKNWVETSCDVKARFGNYVIYRKRTAT